MSSSASLFPLLGAVHVVLVLSLVSESSLLAKLLLHGFQVLGLLVLWLSELLLVFCFGSLRVFSDLCYLRAYQLPDVPLHCSQSFVVLFVASFGRDLLDLVQDFDLHGLADECTMHELRNAGEKQHIWICGLPIGNLLDKGEIQEVLYELAESLFLLFLGHYGVCALAHDRHHDGGQGRLENNLDGFAAHELENQSFVCCR